MVDTFNGEAFLSIVGFQMSHIRLLGLPAIPKLSSLNELNVRTYVRNSNGTPGVYFFSLDCDHWLAVKIARVAFGLKYQHAHIKFDLEQNHFSCLRAKENISANFQWDPQGSLQMATPGTVEFFLLERYIFFTERKNQLWMGRVHHTPYAFSSAKIKQWSESPFQWNQIISTQSAPNLVHACPGVAIEAFPLRLAHA